MTERVFMSTTGSGLARAGRTTTGAFTVEHLLRGTAVRCLAVDPLNRTKVYAGTAGTGVLRSDDGGRSWRPAGLAGRSVMAIAASPVEQEVIYAGTRPAGLFVSKEERRVRATGSCDAGPAVE